VPKDPQARKQWLRKDTVERPISSEMRAALKKRYAEKADGIRYAEGFEICELGRQPSEKELKVLFPF
jgi:hypothetical protein